MKGFTLVEVLVVLAITAVAVGLGLMVSMETYRGSDFRSERDMLVALLERARAQSLSNYCTGCTDARPHGLYVDAAERRYVLYQGSSYASRDAAADSVFGMSPAIAVSGFSEADFAQLSGDGTTAGGPTLTLSDAAGHASVITVGSEGQISWTN